MPSVQAMDPAAPIGEESLAAAQATLRLIEQRIPDSRWDLLHWDAQASPHFLLGRLAGPHPGVQLLNDDGELPPYLLESQPDGDQERQLRFEFAAPPASPEPRVDWLWPLGRRGAAPWICGRLRRAAIESLAERRAWLNSLFAELGSLCRRPGRRDASPVREELGILHHADSPLAGLLEQLARLGPTETPVFLQGESGVGKELFARGLHSLSPRAAAAFVAQNGGALTDTLIESELFGHSRGSFTGAREERVGLFELASGGTFFLDEVGDLSGMLQVRLLRVLQDRQIRRVGENRLRAVDFRLVSATHHDMEELVRSGRFRLDLWFRLQGVKLCIPPLRERRMDIPILARAFLAERVQHLDLAMREIGDEAMDALLRYRWPGNVRELQNEIARVAAFYGEMPRLERWMLSEALFGEESQESPAVVGGLTLQQAQADLERRMIRQTLRRFAGNRSQSARALGLSRQGLLKKLKRLGLERAAFKAKAR